MLRQRVTLDIRCEIKLVLLLYCEQQLPRIYGAISGFVSAFHDNCMRDVTVINIEYLTVLNENLFLESASNNIFS